MTFKENEDMTDFKKIDNMIKYIEDGTLPENKTFNQFAIDFFLETKNVTLSKYLKLSNQEKKIPKIMNTKKAGELLLDSQNNKELPELNYKLIMLLRKVSVLDNWQKVISFIESGKTITEINRNSKKKLLPMETEALENFIKNELSLNETELNWLLNKINKIENSKLLQKSIRKLIKQSESI